MDAKAHETDEIEDGDGRSGDECPDRGGEQDVGRGSTAGRHDERDHEDGAGDETGDEDEDEIPEVESVMHQRDLGDRSLKTARFDA